MMGHAYYLRAAQSQNVLHVLCFLNLRSCTFDAQFYNFKNIKLK